jgi:hypothetical protein
MASWFNAPATHLDVVICFVLLFVNIFVLHLGVSAIENRERELNRKRAKAA